MTKNVYGILHILNFAVLQKIIKESNKILDPLGIGKNYALIQNEMFKTYIKTTRIMQINVKKEIKNTKANSKRRIKKNTNTFKRN